MINKLIVKYSIEELELAKEKKLEIHIEGKDEEKKFNRTNADVRIMN